MCCVLSIIWTQSQQHPSGPWGNDRSCLSVHPPPPWLWERKKILLIIGKSHAKLKHPWNKHCEKSLWPVPTYLWGVGGGPAGVPVSPLFTWPPLWGLKYVPHKLLVPQLSPADFGKMSQQLGSSVPPPPAAQGEGETNSTLNTFNTKAAKMAENFTPPLKPDVDVQISA